jgi:methionine-rich copper-binding protein CopC
MRRTVTRLALLATTVVAALCLAGPASAHAKLVSSSPAGGSFVAPRLTAVTLTFDDVVQLVPRSLVVTGASGVPLTTAPVQLLSSRVVQARLLDRLTAGRYLVAWRVLADDGHIESGSFGFQVAAGAAQHPAATGAPPADAQPVWPVVVAATMAVIALLGAALVVRRGSRAIAAAGGPERYPANSSVGERDSSPSDHDLLRR